MPAAPAGAPAQKRCSRRWKKDGPLPLLCQPSYGADNGAGLTEGIIGFMQWRASQMTGELLRVHGR